MKQDKEKKKDDEDDGRVIANMNLSGFKWYGKSKNETAKPENRLRLTKKERWALFFGSIRAIFPYAFLLLAGFTAAFLLLYLWLS